MLMFSMVCRNMEIYRISDEKRLILTGLTDSRITGGTWCNQHSHAYGTGRIVVWGAVSAQGRSKFAILCGQHNAAYMYTLSEYVLSLTPANHGADDVFQQENASIHTSRETKPFMLKHYDVVCLFPTEFLEPHSQGKESCTGVRINSVRKNIN
ncbi:unnamed protein product [Phytophthora fragariaefolia]|uniref:Unnamed protein product n=1 Tax=Phytophthora fragariaefolia TaxID=1490495 RepID=A0A9W6YGC5_9STRA|nr:unnamed protein product [Phytophthora fragariaefolia]